MISVRVVKHDKPIALNPGKPLSNAITKIFGNVDAAAQKAADGVDEGVEAQQHQDAAVEDQHQRLDVPVTVLEAAVLAARQQAHDMEGESRQGGVER